MAGVCGLRMLHGRNRTLTKNTPVSKQDKIIERIDRHTHDRRRRFFKVQPTDAMEDDWCRVISLTRVTFRPGDQNQSGSEVLARKMLDRLA